MAKKQRTPYSPEMGRTYIHKMYGTRTIITENHFVSICTPYDTDSQRGALIVEWTGTFYNRR
ncbi:MAG TPA: hypothetical protein DCG12_02875 [Planctomycetaceae bacterium]|nr:hypothetical protein [Planctomycetaceae bacterium]